MSAVVARSVVERVAGHRPYAPSDRNFEVVTSTATTQSLAPAPFYVVVTV
jgi:hypothetical protein